MDKTDNKRATIETSDRSTVILACILLTMAILAVYWQVGGFDFVNIDDPFYVKNNNIVGQGITLVGIKWAFTSVYVSNWHPLTWISHMLDVQVFGMRPGLHHFTNVFIHIINTMLLFMLFKNMTGAVWRSAAVAALFALHPIHVESVAWISERKDVLSTFFWILTVTAYIWYIKQRSLQRYLVVVISYILGLISKPMLVTLPFVLLLLDFWPLRRFEEDGPIGDKSSLRHLVSVNKFATLVREKTPLIALAVISSGITFYAQNSGGSVVSQEIIPPATRMINAIISYVTYLEKMLWPLKLAAYYPYSQAFQPLIVIACASILLVITALVLLFVRYLPYLAVGWFWYIGTLIPVIGIIQVGDQSMADRYTYIPLIGVFLMVVWGLRDLLRKWHYGKISLGSSFALIIIPLMWTTWVQIGYWKNSETLFRHTLDIAGNNYFAHFNLAVALYDKGDIDGAIEHYKEALQANPYHASSHKNLGNLLFLKGNIDEAIGHYISALKINKDDAGGYYNLGTVYYKKGNLKKAIEYFQLAIDKNPGYIEAMEKLEVARNELARFPDQTSSIIHEDPQNPKLYINQGDIYRQQGKYDEAITQYQKAISIQPNLTNAMYGLVLTYSSLHKYPQALDMLQKIRQLQPDNP
jgi:protein O-mannosyl-transferase